MLLLLSEVESVSGWVNPVVQIATAGGFGALVWYLVVKHIPIIEERHKEERRELSLAYKEERVDFLMRLDARDLLIKEMQVETTQAMRDLSAAVRILSEKIDKIAR